jgi:hypothetical protein
MLFPVSDGRRAFHVGSVGRTPLPDTSLSIGASASKPRLDKDLIACGFADSHWGHGHLSLPRLWCACKRQASLGRNDGNLFWIASFPGHRVVRMDLQDCKKDQGNWVSAAGFAVQSHCPVG